MTRPRSPRSRNSKARPAPGLNKWLGWALKLGLVGLVLLAGFAIYLDAVVQEKFSGRRWTIPAKVYARPLELFNGLKLSREDFLRELDALGYRREPSVSGPGTVSVAASAVELNTRGFQFYEGAEPAQRVRVRFNGNYVSGLSQANGKELAVARLEPLLIGGLYPAHHEDRILVKLDQVPTYLIDTLVAVEDRDFWNHHGVSLKSVARAVWVNTTAGQLRQGGSTLTQQLVKNFFLSNERSLSRKINEAMMAVLLELHYDKRDILESYLNEVFLGQDGQRAIHGFGLASQYFFSQPLAELKLDQVALLVGMVKGPSYFNPRRYPDRALARRNLVLDVLAEQGVATQQEVDAAKQRPLGVTRQGSMADSSYPAFLDLVKRQLRQDYRDEDLTEEGLRIFTSFDPILQEKAETSVNETLKRLSGRKGVDQVEAAMVVTNPETGEIQALIGSRDPRFAGFNRALDAVRPIGSLIKPAVYLTALERPSKYTLTTWVQDEPFAVKGQDGQVWRPRMARSSCTRAWQTPTTCPPPSSASTSVCPTCCRPSPGWASTVTGQPIRRCCWAPVRSVRWRSPPCTRPSPAAASTRRCGGSAASSLPTASRSSAIRSRSNSASTRAPSTWCRTPCSGSCAKAPGGRCTVNCRRR